jgi:hypothetical protein
VEQQGNLFEQYHEQLKCLLERESPSITNFKLTSSGGVPLGKPIGRHELARQQLLHGCNFFPVHAPNYHDTVDEKEKLYLQVLKIDKEGLTLYQGNFWENVCYGLFTKKNEEKLNKKLGREVSHWNLRTIAQWRVNEYYFSFRYIDNDTNELKSYTIESSEPSSIGKTLESYVGLLMEDLGMDDAGTFKPKVEDFTGSKVRGDNSSIMRKSSVSSRDSPSKSPTTSRRSSFLIDSPLVSKSKSSQKSLISDRGGNVSSSGTPKGKSGASRRRQSMTKMMCLSEDYGVTLISGFIGRRSGGFLGFNKKFQKKFYVVHNTSQGHYLAEYQNENCACIPTNLKSKWKWPKAFIDLATTLRLYSPSIVDTRAGKFFILFLNFTQKSKIIE